MERLSVIIPAYNEEKMVKKAAQTIGAILQSNNIEYELIFVNDGSKDFTGEILKEIALEDKRIKVINFSRNFGKEAAIFAGLSYSIGQACVVIDCDLQHPPETILEMYRLWKDGFEVVEGIKSSRGTESRLKKFMSESFYNIISVLSGIDMKNMSDFKLLDRKAVNVLINMPEKQIFFRALSSWIGFKSTEVTYDVRDREAGETKWSMLSLFKYALSNITSFSSAPLQLITMAGVIFLVFALVLGVQSLYKRISGQAVEGFTTVILLLLIIGSLIMVSLGIIGYYISKIYEEIKSRPRYIVKSVVNSEKKED